MWSVQTPVSRAWLAMSRPSGLSVRRETQAEVRPRRATPTAVFSSAPPTWRSRLRACSSRRKLGGARRIIASPKVITSGMGCRGVGRASGGTSGPGADLLDDGDIPRRQLADAVEVALSDRL